MEEPYKILQIIPCISHDVVSFTQYHGYSREKWTTEYPVYAWALIEQSSNTSVLPMIAGERSLIFPETNQEWKLVRKVY